MRRALLLFLLAFAPRAYGDPAPTAPAPPRIEAPIHPIAPLPDDAPPPAREPADRRPFYIAGGAVVLALVFLWNRERARKLEREHGPSAPRQRRWRVKPDEPDDDADALADAAEDKDDKHE